MEINTEQFKIFSDYLVERGWHIDRVTWRIQDHFKGLDWRGKDVLEIGCGSAEIAIYMALTGARRVVGLDPIGAGSNMTAHNRRQGLVQKLNLRNFEFYPVTFQDFDQMPESFDIIFGINSIEHIYETMLPLNEDKEAYNLYRNYFKDIRTMLRPNGVMMQSNNSRYSLAAYLSWLTKYRLRYFISRTICWELHQTPETWVKVAKDAGFSSSHFNWRTMFPLRQIPWITRFGIVPFFLSAEYNVFASK